jgi:hypothetical protein
MLQAVADAALKNVHAPHAHPASLLPLLALPLPLLALPSSLLALLSSRRRLFRLSRQRSALSDGAFRAGAASVTHATDVPTQPLARHVCALAAAGTSTTPPGDHEKSGRPRT